MELHSDLIKESEQLIGGKGDNPTGNFKKWLDSDEGQKALSRGIQVEMEHTKKRSIAREIATDHLKEDRAYYQKLAKVGLDEGIYDDPKAALHDLVDDLEDQGEDSEENAVVMPPKPGFALAIDAVNNPDKAKAKAGRDAVYHRNLMVSLRHLTSMVTTLVRTIPQPTTEASMGVAGPMIAEPSTDAGSGIPVKDPLRKGNRVKKPVPAKRLPLGSPATSSMVGANPMVPGRSAFAKGIE